MDTTSGGIILEEDPKKMSTVEPNRVPQSADNTPMYADILKPKPIYHTITRVLPKPIVKLHGEPNITWKSSDVRNLIILENLMLSLSDEDGEDDDNGKSDDNEGESSSKEENENRSEDDDGFESKNEGENGIIIADRKKAPSVVGDVGSSPSITKGGLNFKTKAWWTMVRHRLSPTLGDNVLSPDKAYLVASSMAVQELPDIDQFIKSRTTTDLGLIRDDDNPISKAAKIGATMIREIFEAISHGNNTIRFTNMGATPMKTTQSEPQTSTKAAGTF
ncbi:hypothetical protein FXO37_04880 [Capsicum annuum]|nr:hypothetical protein FXO37_04880 [Capsicum annuum]